MNYKNKLAAKLLLNPDVEQYMDIIEVVVPLLTLNQKVRFATLCARSVLYIFEEKYPDDKCPRDCLDFLDSIEDFESLTEEQREKLRKHRNDTAYTAADTAYTAADAAAYAAAYAAADAASNKQEQQVKNLQFLKEVIEC